MRKLILAGLLALSACSTPAEEFSIEGGPEHVVDAFVACEKAGHSGVKFVRTEGAKSFYRCE